MNFEIITRDTAGSIPLVAHVPHSSTIIPPDIRQTLCLDDHELQRELLCMTDWYTDRLFDLSGLSGLSGFCGFPISQPNERDKPNKPEGPVLGPANKTNGTNETV